MVGQLIVFEGIEGAGKTTQLQRAAAWLRSQVTVPVLTTREPGGNAVRAGVASSAAQGAGGG